MNWDNLQSIAQFDDIPLDAASSPNQNGSGDGTASTAYAEQRSIAELATAKPTTSISLLIESLVQLLCLVLEGDPKIAETSYKSICEQLNEVSLIDDSYSMKEFEEIRSQYQMQIYKIVCAARGQEIPITLPTVGTNPQTVETCWSRYRREFDEVSFIAGGGFGKVYRARHKLDTIEYAVKQIKIHSTTIKLCHLAEVKTIASLNHPNVVQYKAAWLEPNLHGSRNNSECKTEKSRNDTSEETESSEEIFDESSSSPSESRNEKSIGNGADESSDFIQFEHDENEIESISMDSKKVDHTVPNKIVCRYESNSVKCLRSKTELAMLYIQMSLCQITLRSWLDDRNRSPDMDEFYGKFFSRRDLDTTHLDIVNDIFCQILTGLHYIHSRGIVHHDIKPSNIFLKVENDGKLIAQLGDFGLACPLQNGHRGIALGTPMYAAPEQLDGECNPKSDIFSLGIVLLELLLKFKTDMERVRTIENARKGSVPSDLSTQSSHLILNLLNHASIRPNTKELLEVIRAINLEQNLRALRVSQIDVKLKDVKIKELKYQIKLLQEDTLKKNSEISQLLEQVQEKNRIITQLKLDLEAREKTIQRISNESSKKNAT